MNLHCPRSKPWPQLTWARLCSPAWREKLQRLGRPFPLLCRAVQATQSWSVQVCRAKFIMCCQFSNVNEHGIFFHVPYACCAAAANLEDSFILYWCAYLQFGLFFSRITGKLCWKSYFFIVLLLWHIISLAKLVCEENSFGSHCR